MGNGFAQFGEPIKRVWSSLKAGRSAGTNVLLGSLNGTGLMGKLDSLGSTLLSGARREWMPSLAGGVVGAGIGAASGDRDRGGRAIAGGFLGAMAGNIGGQAWRNRARVSQVARSVAEATQTGYRRARSEAMWKSAFR